VGVPIDDDIAWFAAEHHGVVAVGRFDDGVLTHRARHVRLDNGRWQELYPGVYRIGGAPPSWRGDLLAACWAGGPRAVASHRAAAALWGFPGGREDVEITCPRWRRTQKDGELVVHESRVLTAADVAERDAIPCTTVERTIFDLAAVVGPRTLDLAVDSALRRELTTIAELVSLGARVAKRGRAGSARYRAVLADRDPRVPLPESEPERLLAEALVRHGLPRPSHQFVVTNALGAFIARVDLAYPDDRIVIEYESYAYHTGKVALARDSARRNAIVGSGFTVLTATAEDLHDDAARLAGEVRRVRNATNRRQSKPLKGRD
jgi:very-short-patch-repair endonuclease